MYGDYRVYDADAHVKLSPRMWQDLAPEYRPRRPRPLLVADPDDMGRYKASWLFEGRMEPHPFGPGAQPADIPTHVLEDFGASGEKIGSLDLSDPEARLQDLDRMSIDVQLLFPTTLYARMTSDAGFEAALYRAYNRYVARQCQYSPGRLKWAGLVPLRDPYQALRALEEMLQLGATAAVVYGTVGDRLLSDPTFTPFWDEFGHSGLPLCVHMGRSYPPFDNIVEGIFDAHVIGMALPAQLAFVALVGHGLLDRYPDLRIAFLEFGAEWIFYMIGRMDHYLPEDRLQPAIAGRLPSKAVSEYVRSGRIFMAGEADDPLLVQEIALMGEGQFLFSSDYPHAERRENALMELMDRRDITDEQRQKILYDNAVRFFGEP